MSSKWYGSLNNRIAERTKGETPTIGMGVTEFCYSDRHPYEVIAIKDERHITVRELDATRTDSNGMSESQDYEYTSNPDNRTAELFFTKQGAWRERIGRRLGSTRWRVGYAEKYYDYSF